jgi:hypothetical protein
MARRRRPTCAAPVAFASSNGAFAPETWDPDGAASLPKLYEALPRRRLWHQLCAAQCFQSRMSEKGVGKMVEIAEAMRVGVSCGVCFDLSIFFQVLDPNIRLNHPKPESLENAEMKGLTDLDAG